MNRPAPASATSSPSALDIRDLTKVFGGFTAVDRVRFEVAPGEIFGLLGPNGAGKSTLIRMLCGLLQPTAGTALVAGRDIRRDPERARAAIGYMAQRFSLYRDLTVRENLMFYGGAYGLNRAALAARIPATLAETHIEARADTLAGALSGAIQQRLSLAAAILHQPCLLLLDEPTSGIDPLARRAFWDLIRRFAAGGVTVLVTTHFLDEAELCGRLAFINAGRLLALGSPAELKRAAVPEDVYDLAVADAASGRARLAAIDGVAAVAYYGSRLHAFTAPGRYTVATLAQAAAGAGVAASAVRRVPVSMEDAFVRLAARTAA